MSARTIEDIYTALADGIDTHGPEQAEMFLAKVCLLLSQEIDDTDRVLQLIGDAQTNMTAMRAPEG